MSDTICAVASPPGAGAVALIRVCGDNALAICNALFFPKSGKLLDRPPHTLVFGSLRRQNEIIDEALAAVFRAPHSFTGEDTVEFTCHGSIYVQQQILRLLVDNGCRLARPGEFTQRAFLNGKMDLSQAEAVADLIAATSKGQHQLAMQQLRGGYSQALNDLRAQLLDFAALLELELDFADEDIAFADRAHLLELANNAETTIGRLADSFQTGNAVKNGISVAIIGQTNAGKSSLLNLLTNDQRALVSHLPGTTRDALEETVSLQGISFRFIDTAGIRPTRDALEQLAIDRSLTALSKANIALWVIDLAAPTRPLAQLAHTLAPFLKGKHTLLLFNKTDLLAPAALTNKKRLLKNFPTERLYISVKQQTGIEQLKASLLRAAQHPNLPPSDIIVTNLRHYQALTLAREALHRVIEGLRSNLPAELIAQDLRQATLHIGEITGLISSDNILAHIFSRFCIGK